MQFNLLEEQWIPALRHNGDVQRVGVRTALTEAASIRQLAASNPMDNVAILRFLLAVLYWCRGSPRDHDNDRKSDLLPAEWLAKLDAHPE